MLRREHLGEGAPELFAAASSVGDRPALCAAVTCSSPNNEFEDVIDPVAAVPSQPISGAISANMGPAPCCR